MNRKLRTTVPISRDIRLPIVPDYATMAEKDSDLCHAGKELPTLSPGDTVYVKGQGENGNCAERDHPTVLPGPNSRRNVQMKLSSGYLDNAD